METGGGRFRDRKDGLVLETFLRGMETLEQPDHLRHLPKGLETFLRGMETISAAATSQGSGPLETFLRGMETHPGGLRLRRRQGP